VFLQVPVKVILRYRMFKGKLMGYGIFRANKMVYWVRILSLIFAIGIDRIRDIILGQKLLGYTDPIPSIPNIPEVDH